MVCLVRDGLYPDHGNAGHEVTHLVVYFQGLVVFRLGVVGLRKTNGVIDTCWDLNRILPW
jgi:hypothetical protein